MSYQVTGMLTKKPSASSCIKFRTGLRAIMNNYWLPRTPHFSLFWSHDSHVMQCFFTWVHIVYCSSHSCVTQKQKRDDFEHTDSDVPLEDDMLHTWHKLSIHFHPETEVFIPIIIENKEVRKKITYLISSEVIWMCVLHIRQTSEFRTVKLSGHF